MHQVDDLFGFSACPWEGAWQAGVDEVGIGPLAGPVVAAAVVLDPSRPIEGLTDSKALTQKRREALDIEIRERALCFAIAEASVAEIDRLNVLAASHLAMRRAVDALSEVPSMIWVDGNKTPAVGAPVVAVVKGDARIPQIGAASILAKVYRDTLMQRLSERYPDYGFAGHKGYPTKAHVEALEKHGACPEHRCSFAPVRAVMETPRTHTGPQPELLQPTLIEAEGAR